MMLKRVADADRCIMWSTKGYERPEFRNLHVGQSPYYYDIREYILTREDMRCRLAARVIVRNFQASTSVALI